MTERTQSGDEAPPPEPNSSRAVGSEKSDSAERADNRTDPRVEALENRVVELDDRWKRALADVDNVRKRLTSQIAASRADERRSLATEWLSILDNLDLALEHAEGDPASIVEGVRAVRDQARALLARLGFDLRQDVGQPFDPHLHEAVGTIATDEVDPGTIVHVVRPGYGEGDDQLRPTAVVVARDVD